VYVCTFILSFRIRACGHAMKQLVEALRYKPEGHGFDWNRSLT